MSILALILSAAICTVYPATGAILTVPGDYVQITLQSGHVYEIDNAGGDWSRGDIVSVIFSDNGTPGDVTDDKILNVRYSGYITGGAIESWIK